MREYVKGMLDSFPIKFKEGETAMTPAGDGFGGQMSNNDKKLHKNKAEEIHTATGQ